MFIDVPAARYLPGVQPFLRNLGGVIRIGLQYNDQWDCSPISFDRDGLGSSNRLEYLVRLGEKPLPNPHSDGWRGFRRPRNDENCMLDDIF
jgi:hypothetical protein